MVVGVLGVVTAPRQEDRALAVLQSESAVPTPEWLITRSASAIACTRSPAGTVSTALMRSPVDVGRAGLPEHLG